MHAHSRTHYTRHNCSYAVKLYSTRVYLAEEAGAGGEAAECAYSNFGLRKNSVDTEPNTTSEHKWKLLWIMIAHRICSMRIVREIRKNACACCQESGKLFIFATGGINLMVFVAVQNTAMMYIHIIRTI